jgi:hypothetical protein
MPTIATSEPLKGGEAQAPGTYSWKKSETSLALLQGDKVVWQFNYGNNLDVPYFHPLTAVAGQPLTWDAPPDHVWHHGLWFSWKFINEVNYWELNPATGKPDGRTQWSDVRVETRDDHSARISLKLGYRPATGDRVVLEEERLIAISPPEPTGVYRIDWSSKFVAGSDQVVLDRTPPQNRAWGGYAGLSVRFARDFTERRAVNPSGPVVFNADSRHRSRATAVEYNGLLEGNAVGIAFLDHPDNGRHPTPWYLIDSPVMGFMNAALLQDEALSIKPGETLTLNYRLIVHPGRWDGDQLEAARRKFHAR